MEWAVLGLGTNLGARRAILEGALALLGPLALGRSRLYATPPLGPPQPDYLNAAVRVRWQGPLSGLLARTQAIERSFGRERGVRWGPRTLDVDILHWSGGELATPELSVPHPGLTERAFALAPLLDVAPELRGLGARLRELGGPPPVARPGWSRIVRQGGELCGEWLHDPDELAAQFVALACFGRARGASLAALPFTGPSGLLHGDVLAGIVHDACSSQFAPRACVVLARDERECKGVLLGIPGVREAPPAASPRLAWRADGARRFVVPRPASSWL